MWFVWALLALLVSDYLDTFTVVTSFKINRRPRKVPEITDTCDKYINLDWSLSRNFNFEKLNCYWQFFFRCCVKNIFESLGYRWCGKTTRRKWNHTDKNSVNTEYLDTPTTITCVHIDVKTRKIWNWWGKLNQMIYGKKMKIWLNLRPESFARIIYRQNQI